MLSSYIGATRGRHWRSLVAGGRYHTTINVLSPLAQTIHRYVHFTDSTDMDIVPFHMWSYDFDE